MNSLEPDRRMAWEIWSDYAHKLEEELETLKSYIQQQAKVADANSHEWQPNQASGITDKNAAYRAGMWYAYRDILNRLP